jgi:hypothetical protein
MWKKVTGTGTPYLLNLKFYEYILTKNISSRVVVGGFYFIRIHKGIRFPCGSGSSKELFKKQIFQNFNKIFSHFWALGSGSTKSLNKDPNSECGSATLILSLLKEIMSSYL